MSATKPGDRARDLDDLRDRLLLNLEELAEHFMGEPSLRGRSQWRWGTKGSFSLELTGRDRGLFISHETGKGDRGGLNLIMAARDCSFGEAVREAKAWLGDRGDTRQPAARPARAPGAQTGKAERIAKARQLWSESTAIVGTPAEFYLVKARGIPAPAAGWPDVFRFHAPSCSLIAAATTPEGEVQAVQLVRLTVDGAKDEDPSLAYGCPAGASKPINGVRKGAAVRLPGDAAGPVVVAEGLETGLSVWVATGLETWIAMGTVLAVEPLLGRQVILARDDDPTNRPADQAHRKTREAWTARGVRLAIATPWPERRGDKTDFNDVLQEGGADAVRARITAALAPVQTDDGRHELPVEEARAALGAATNAFFVAAVDHVPGAAAPPVHAIRADVGLGKSQAAHAGAVEMLAAMRARGDRRTVIIALPRHDLITEAVEAFNGLSRAIAAGLVARSWRGRGADDPSTPGEHMCRDLERTKAAAAAGQSVEQTVCSSCPLASSCAYMAQGRQPADVWFVPHELMFAGRPAAFCDVAALVVDESPVRAGLIDGETLALADLDLEPRDVRLHELRIMLAKAVHAAGDGPLQRALLLKGGMTAEMADEALTLERRRWRGAVPKPDATPAERKWAAAKARGVRHMMLLWTAVRELVRDGGPAASGWAALATEAREGGHVRLLRLKGRRAVHQSWAVPTLLLDANLNIDLVRPFWPAVRLVADVAAAAPHMRIIQATDRSFAKGYFFNKPEEEGEAEAPVHEKHLRDMHARVALIARRYAPGPVLVVAQKAVREALEAVSPTPANVTYAHHNGVAGRDCWRNAAAVVIIGRTAPPPHAVERQAEALTGRAVEPVTGWYPRAAAARRVTSGDSLPAEADRHPDPVVEALRWTACEGELLQIIGRARGVNRTAANPVDVLVLTDCVLPMPVAATMSAGDLDPTPSDYMLARHGIAFDNPGDAAAAYPELWANREAAKKAIARASKTEEVGDIPVWKDSSHRGLSPTSEPSPSLRRLTYQRAGAGRSRSMAWFDPAVVRDPAAKLRELLGELSFVEVEEGATSTAEPEPVAARPVLHLVHAVATPKTPQIATGAIVRPAPRRRRDVGRRPRDAGAHT